MLKGILAKEEKKVEYLELIYDLIFVYVIGRNNQVLHYIENGAILLHAGPRPYTRQGLLRVDLETFQNHLLHFLPVTSLWLLLFARAREFPVQCREVLP